MCHAANDHDRKDDATAAGALKDVEDGLAQAPAMVEERLEAKGVCKQTQPKQVGMNA